MKVRLLITSVTLALSFYSFQAIAGEDHEMSEAYVEDSEMSELSDDTEMSELSDDTEMSELSDDTEMFEADEDTDMFEADEDTHMYG